MGQIKGNSLLYRTQVIKNTYHSGITIYKRDVFMLVEQLRRTRNKYNFTQNKLYLYKIYCSY